MSRTTIQRVAHVICKKKAHDAKVCHAFSMSAQFMELPSIKTIFNASKMLKRAILNHASHEDLNKYFSLWAAKKHGSYSGHHDDIVDEVVSRNGYLIITFTTTRFWGGSVVYEAWHEYMASDGIHKTYICNQKIVPYKYMCYVNDNIEKFVSMHGHLFNSHVTMFGNKYMKGVDISNTLHHKIKKHSYMSSTVVSCLKKSIRAGILTSKAMKVMFEYDYEISSEMMEFMEKTDMTNGGEICYEFLSYLSRMSRRLPRYVDVSLYAPKLFEVVGGKIGAYPVQVKGVSMASLSIAAVHYNRQKMDDIKQLSNTASPEDIRLAIDEMYAEIRLISSGGR